MNEYNKPRSLFFPLLLVVLGVFLLLTNLGTIEGSTWSIVSTYWPLIFVVGGLDGLYRRDGWVGSLVFIGLGTLLLLGNLHYLQWGGLDLLLRLWPVLLVGWGLDVAFGHNSSTWSTILRVGLGILLIGGIVWLAMVGPFTTPAKIVNFSQSLDGATSSEINVSLAAGELHLTGAAADSVLAEGNVYLPNSMTMNPSYTEPVEGRSKLDVQGAGIVVLPMQVTSYPWNLKINSSIPIDLTTKEAMGLLVTDASDINLERLTVQQAMGKTLVTLPENVSFEGSINNAIGEIVIRVPKGTALTLHTDTGIVSVDMPASYTRTQGQITSPSGDYRVDLNVNIAIGSLVIEEIN
ncbi:MAG: DUF5668 domain-containing protein [Anaerolineaceae bacterium]|nr:DUF5668 domain-containing protein [Anaerolineaceae bacterium]